MNFVYVVLSLVVFWCAVSKFIFDAAIRGSVVGAMLALVVTSESKKDRDESATEFGRQAFHLSAYLATDLLVMLMSAVAAVFFLLRG